MSPGPARRPGDATPSTVDEVVARLDAVVRAGLARTGTPGAVVFVTVDGDAVATGAWGLARRADRDQPAREMRIDTIHDVASITKLVATTAVTHQLVAAGRLELDAPVVRWLPELAGADDVTVADLLGHTSGLPGWAPLAAAATEGVDPLRVIAEALLAVRGTGTGGAARVTYSDLGMAALGRLLERAADRSLATLVHDLVLAPLGCTDTRYGPLPSALRDRAAATSHGQPAERALLLARRPDLAAEDPRRWAWWRDDTHVGEVDDANAAIAFGGVAGHAGLFSTAADLTRFAVALLRLADDPDPVTARFLTAGPDADLGLGVWRRRLTATLGVDHPAVAGGDRSLGHRGFTGAELLVDPDRRLTVVLLSTRLHGADPRTGATPDHAALWVPLLATVLDVVDRRS